MKVIERSWKFEFRRLANLFQDLEKWYRFRVYSAGEPGERIESILLALEDFVDRLKNNFLARKFESLNFSKPMHYLQRGTRLAIGKSERLLRKFVCYIC